MTRRGSLAYYLAAWICACSFMSAAMWIKDLGGSADRLVTLDGVFGLLLYSFYGLISGMLSSLLGAFLLRRLTVFARWEKPWQWTLAGAALAPAVLGALGVWGEHLMQRKNDVPWLLRSFTYGPAFVLGTGLWLTIPAGAATAFVLYRIHRAFVPQPDAEHPTPSAS